MEKINLLEYMYWKYKSNEHDRGIPIVAVILKMNSLVVIGDVITTDRRGNNKNFSDGLSHEKHAETKIARILIKNKNQFKKKVDILVTVSPCFPCAKILRKSKKINRINYLIDNTWNKRKYNKERFGGIDFKPLFNNKEKKKFQNLDILQLLEVHTFGNEFADHLNLKFKKRSREQNSKRIKYEYNQKSMTITRSK